MIKNRKLSRALILNYAIVIFIPLLFVGVSSLISINQIITGQIEDSQLRLAKSYANEVESFLEEPGRLVKDVERVVFIDKLIGSSSINDYLDVIVSGHPFLQSLQITDYYGHVIYLSPYSKDTEGIDLSGQDFYRACQESNKPVWSSTFISPETGNIAVTLTYPVEDGAVVAYINLDELNNVIRYMHASQSFTAIIDRTGKFIAHTEIDNVLLQVNARNIKPAYEAIQGNTGVYSYEYKGEQWITGTASIASTGWTVLYGQRKEKVFSTYNRLQRLLSLGGIFAVALALIIGVWSISRLLMPLKKLSATIMKIAGGEYNLQLEDTYYREFNILLKDVQKMAKAIRIREKALSHSEEKYRILIDTVPNGIYETDLNGKIIFFNKAFARTLEYEENELLDKYAWSFSHRKDSNDKFLHMFNLILESDPKFKSYVSKWMTKTGKIIEVKIDWENRYDQNGIHTGCIAILSDITYSRQASRELSREKERLAVTLASIGDGVITTDTDGKIMLLNKAAEELTGWSSDDARGREFGEVFNLISEETGKAEKSPVETVMEKDGAIELPDNSLLRQKGGREINIADSAAPIRDKDLKIIGVVVVFRDITEKRKLATEIQKTQKLESLGILAGGIAHDFNNLLTGILGNLSIAATFRGDSPEMNGILNKINRAAERAKSLTQQLLTFAKGGMPVKKTMHLEELIKDSASFVLSGSNVSYQCSLQPGLWLADIDEGQISQVINNLVINANQSMPDGGTIHITAENLNFDSNQYFEYRQNRYIKICIRDFGHGIPQEIRDKIFDPYFTTKEKGHGLGLAASYSIIKKHGGFLTFSDNPEGGAEFSILLPASDKKPVAEKTGEPKIEKGQGKILIMDDEDIIRDVMASMLQQLGYEADAAKNGEEALEMYKTGLEKGNPYSFVVMDLTIPGGMGGREAVKKLLEIDPDAKAVVTSGYSHDPIMAEYDKYGFSYFLVKPFRISDLTEVISQLNV